MIYVNGREVREIYYGDTPVEEVYVGDKLVWGGIPYPIKTCVVVFETSDSLTSLADGLSYSVEKIMAMPIQIVEPYLRLIAPMTSASILSANTEAKVSNDSSLFVLSKSDLYVFPRIYIIQKCILGDGKKDGYSGQGVSIQNVDSLTAKSTRKNTVGIKDPIYSLKAEEYPSFLFNGTNNESALITSASTDIVDSTKEELLYSGYLPIQKVKTHYISSLLDLNNDNNNNPAISLVESGKLKANLIKNSGKITAPIYSMSMTTYIDTGSFDTSSIDDLDSTLVSRIDEMLIS